MILRKRPRAELLDRLPGCKRMRTKRKRCRPADPMHAPKEGAYAFAPAHADLRTGSKQRERPGPAAGPGPCAGASRALGACLRRPGSGGPPTTSPDTTATPSPAEPEQEPEDGQPHGPGTVKADAHPREGFCTRPRRCDAAAWSMSPRRTLLDDRSVSGFLPTFNLGGHAARRWRHSSMSGPGAVSWLAPGTT